MPREDYIISFLIFDNLSVNKVYYLTKLLVFPILLAKINVLSDKYKNKGRIFFLFFKKNKNSSYTYSPANVAGTKNWEHFVFINLSALTTNKAR